MTRPKGIYLTLLAVLLSPIVAQADPITLTLATSSELLQDDFSGIAVTQSVYNGNGFDAAESFVGLTVNDPGGNGFEYFSDSPTNPLTLDAGDASDGVYGSGNLAAGLAGGTGGGDVGEGVLAFLFDYDLLELGLTIGGANPDGSTTFFFYGSNGSLIDTIVTFANNGDLTFSSTMAFRGVAIENTDPGGQYYDNFRFSSTPVPEPGTLALLGLGLVGIAARRRKTV